MRCTANAGRNEQVADAHPIEHESTNSPETKRKVNDQTEACAKQKDATDERVHSRKNEMI
jgi:hypothetical protein